MLSDGENLCNLIPGTFCLNAAGVMTGVLENLKALIPSAIRNCLHSYININTIHIFFQLSELIYKPRVAYWWLSGKIRPQDVFCLADDISKVFTAPLLDHRNHHSLYPSLSLQVCVNRILQTNIRVCGLGWVFAIVGAKHPFPLSFGDSTLICF